MLTLMRFTCLRKSSHWIHNEFTWNVRKTLPVEFYFLWELSYWKDFFYICWNGLMKQTWKWKFNFCISSSKLFQKIGYPIIIFLLLAYFLKYRVVEFELNCKSFRFIRMRILLLLSVNASNLEFNLMWLYYFIHRNKNSKNRSSWSFY